MQPTRNVFWTAELSFIAGVLGSYLQGVSKDAFAMRNEGLESSPSTILKALPIAIQRSELWCFSLAF